MHLGLVCILVDHLVFLSVLGFFSLFYCYFGIFTFWLHLRFSMNIVKWKKTHKKETKTNKKMKKQYRFYDNESLD